MKFGLEDDLIIRLQSIFSSYTVIEKVLIYGSRAIGNYREGSDIDLVILGDNLNNDILMEIKSKIEDLNSPYMFNILIYNNIKNKDLIASINSYGKILYARENK